MKALIYTELQKLEYLDRPKPVLDHGEALVKIAAAGVCGSDIHGWQGRSRGRIPPMILGHELAGTLVELYEAHATFRISDRVAIYPFSGCGICIHCQSDRDCICQQRKALGLHVPGGFAEYVKVPTKNLYSIPKGMEFTTAALVEPVATTLRMLGASRNRFDAWGLGGVLDVIAPAAPPPFSFGVAPQLK